MNRGDVKLTAICVLALFPSGIGFMGTRAGYCVAQGSPEIPRPQTKAGPLSFPDSRQNTTRKIVEFLVGLQDSVETGMVPIQEHSLATTTYVNAMAAIAFTVGGRPDRAVLIFDAFLHNPDPCPNPDIGGADCPCQGGFQQHRDAGTGLAVSIPEAPNDFWIGDNAWLLTALTLYEKKTGDSSFRQLRDQLSSWLVCLAEGTPEPGIYSGYRKDGSPMEFRHPEGSIDVYGALADLNAEAVRASIKTWLETEVWVPGEPCFEIGPANGPPGQTNLPTDNVSWGILAFGGDYGCLTAHAEGRTARTLSPYVLDSFDREVLARPGGEGRWQTEVSDPQTVSLSVDRQRHGAGHDLTLTYSFGPDQWFRLFRDQDIDLAISEEFRYYFRLLGNGSGNRFEVKFRNAEQRSFIYDFDIDFVGWQTVEVRHDQLRDFDPNNPSPSPLSRIASIEFAVNAAGNAASQLSLQLGEIRYRDSGTPLLEPLDGFTGFEAEDGRIWLEGTAQMAVAYWVSGKPDRWHYYLSQLTKTAIAPQSAKGIGLPNGIAGGDREWQPEAVASAWFVLALNRVNPFAP